MKNSIYQFLFICFLTVTIFSCSQKSSTEPEPDFFDVQGTNGFVGMVDDTDAFIALLVASDEGIVYVCNGDEEIAEWFRGTVTDPKSINLTNSAGAQIGAQFKGNSFQGTITLRNDHSLTFQATPNTDKDSGIYRVYGEEAEQDEIEAGWILDSEGDQRGSLRIGNSFQRTVRLGNASDGTSNTVFISERAFPVRSFQVQRSTADSVSIVAPNN